MFSKISRKYFSIYKFYISEYIFQNVRFIFQKIFFRSRFQKTYFKYKMYVLESIFKKHLIKIILIFLKFMGCRLELVILWTTLIHCQGPQQISAEISMVDEPLGEIWMGSNPFE